MPMRILLFIAVAPQLNHWTLSTSCHKATLLFYFCCYKKSGTGREYNNTLQKMLQTHHYFPVSTSKEVAASEFFSQAETATGQTVLFFKNTWVHGRNINQTICKNCTKKRSCLCYRSVSSTTFLISFFRQCYRYLQWWYLENFVSVGSANKHSPFQWLTVKI